MDAILRKIVTFPNVTLFSIAEVWLLTKILPQKVPELNQYIPENNTLAWALIRTLPLNYVLLFLYWGLIYNYFISPLRHFPAARVRIRHMYDMEDDAVSKSLLGPTSAIWLLDRHGKATTRPTLSRMGFSKSDC